MALSVDGAGAGTVEASPIIECKRVHKHFGTLHVLKGIDLRVREGEVIVLIDPSGSGKSTLLRCINRLEPIDGGSLVVAGCTSTIPAATSKRSGHARMRAFLSKRL